MTTTPETKSASLKARGFTLAVSKMIESMGLTQMLAEAQAVLEVHPHMDGVEAAKRATALFKQASDLIEEGYKNLSALLK